MSRSIGHGHPQNAVPGPYILRSLFADVQLSEDGTNRDIHITCAEFWNDNLYIGTSAGEVIHYVLIPPDPQDTSSEPTFIQGLRFSAREGGVDSARGDGPGVEQILVLPAAAKVCILADGLVTIYNLPELSPAYGGAVRIKKVSWIGGVDLDQDPDSDDGPSANVIAMCVRKMIRFNRLGEQPVRVADIEIGGCLDVCRRGNIACVANSKSYSLLDVVEQASIHITEVCAQSSDDVQPASTTAVSGEKDQESGKQQGSNESSTPSEEASKEASPAQGPVEDKAETGAPPRTSSLGIPARVMGHARNQSTASVLSTTTNARRMRPHIASPTSNEFLLTTGTTIDEPGLGSFVNLDGETVRGTIEFSRYPSALVVEGDGVDMADSTLLGRPVEEGYVLAVIPPPTDHLTDCYVEVQRWDLDPGDPANRKYHLNLEASPDEVHAHVGIRQSATKQSVILPQITQCLISQRSALRADLKLPSPSKEDKARDKSETEFVSRLAVATGAILLWSGNKVWWTIRTPLVVRLDALLNAATDDTNDASVSFINRQAVERCFNELRGKEPQTELDFIGHKYIRQKASLLLFLDLVDQALDGTRAEQSDYSMTEQALTEAEIDPRLLLVSVPVLCDEVHESKSGTWIQSGLKTVIDSFLQRRQLPTKIDPSSSFVRPLLDLVKRFLLFWRQRKGYGSTVDETEVFLTVDGSLLHLLLILDKLSPRGPAQPNSLRAELNNMVDTGIEGFDHAADLLQKHHRLYVLSRLYQSKRSSPQVLAIWKRIVMGERDEGGELLDGEEDMRGYLTNIRDAKLVEEYGSWLANRNPPLGVKVFANNRSKVRYEPREAVKILQEHAPGAVRYYLEHLVFDKNMEHYVDDLVSYYLEIVINELKSNPTARHVLQRSYEDYRALPIPKPAYAHFATARSLDADWWRARLRLLQLLGGSHGATAGLDADAVLARVQPFADDLVPEMILLWGGKQGRHADALRLLVRDLADFDSATTYCFLGGPSTFGSTLGPRMPDNLPAHGEQAVLFQYLLSELMALGDHALAMRQSAALLDRYSGWFDIEQVLELVPSEWSVEMLSGFLERALRQLVSERRETAVTMALQGGVNLDVAARLVEKGREGGAKVDHSERDEEGRVKE